MKQSFDSLLCLQFAIENAINYDKCHSKTGGDKMACLLDKATVNIGALFSKQVEGRISTEVCHMALLRVSSDFRRLLALLHPLHHGSPSYNAFSKGPMQLDLGSAILRCFQSIGMSPVRPYLVSALY